MGTVCRKNCMVSIFCSLLGQTEAEDIVLRRAVSDMRHSTYLRVYVDGPGKQKTILSISP